MLHWLGKYSTYTLYKQTFSIHTIVQKQGYKLCFESCISLWITNELLWIKDDATSWCHLINEPGTRVHMPRFAKQNSSWSTLGVIWDPVPLIYPWGIPTPLSTRLCNGGSFDKPRHGHHSMTSASDQGGKGKNNLTGINL